MKAGDTFRETTPSPGSIDENKHLWIILTDTTRFPDQVLISFLTTWTKRRDKTCILEVGDHPFIRHRSCIAYAATRITTLEKLNQELADSRIRANVPLEMRDLIRIRRLFSCSHESLFDHREIALEQGFDASSL